MWGIPILFEIKLRAYRYRAFCSGRHMIVTCPKLNCLTALIRFFLFKGPGSFKRSQKNCGNEENLKANRMIPPMTPVLNGWTIPLSIFNVCPACPCLANTNIPRIGAKLRPKYYSLEMALYVFFKSLN